MSQNCTILSAGILTFLITSSVSPCSYAAIDQAIDDASRPDPNLNRLGSTLRALQSLGATRGDLIDVVNELEMASSPELVRRALRTLLPAINRSAAIRQRVTDNRWRNRKSDTQRLRRSTKSNSNQVLRATALNYSWYAAPSEQNTNTGVAPDKIKNIWLQTWTDSAEQDDQDFFDGFEATQTGVALGLDLAITENLDFGVSIGRYSGEVDSNIFGEDQSNGTQLGVYVARSYGNHTISAQLNNSRDQIDRERLMIVLTETQPRTFLLTSDIDSQQIGYSIDYSYSFLPDLHSTSSFMFSPFASVAYAEIQTDNYIERGSETLSLSVETQDEEHLSGTIGATLGWAYFHTNWTVMPSLTLAFEHDFQADPTVTTSRFRDTTLTFDTEGLELEENRWRYNLGLSLIHRNNIGIGFSYQGQRKGDYRYDGVVLNLQISI
ncbi:MAG: autotransporter outer membrane beta-barrel domain-containing protein [Pseudomonadota bacterium]